MLQAPCALSKSLVSGAVNILTTTEKIMRQFLKSQPRGLYYLFLTDLWERFSYYGITAILILYMDKTFGLPKQQVYAIYGAYGAMIYLVPLLGGWIADKFWGNYYTAICGIYLIALGHFVVALRDSHFYFFYLGLAMIILGTGLFTPNVHATVGHLYESHDTRREGGFTLAYMGRNVGTIIAPLICAWIAAKTDWRWAFIVAGFGMLVGLWTFIKGKPYYHARSFIPATQALSKERFKSIVYMLLFAGFIIIYFMMRQAHWVGFLLWISLVAVITRVSWIAVHQKSQQRRQIIVALILTFFYVIFMILLQQSGGALNLFTDRYVNRDLGGYVIETGMFQAVEPLALVLLTPLYTRFWHYLYVKKWIMTDAVKFSIALLVMGSSFLLMAVSLIYQKQSLIAMSWINVTYILQAASELFIGPIGLAMVTRLVPKESVGFFIGVWVMAASIANYAAAKIGAWITPDLHKAGAIFSYREPFIILGVLGTLAGVILFCLRPWLKKGLTLN